MSSFSQNKYLLRFCFFLNNFRLGLVGRNGTGKTSFLRAMALHAIEGIPKNCQILHVEQEVVGDDTTALQCVLNADVERIQLLDEEARLHARQVALHSVPLNFFLSYFLLFLKK